MKCPNCQQGYVQDAGFAECNWCDATGEIPFLDFPMAWKLAKQTPMQRHHEECSFRVTEGGVLCDCEVLTKWMQDS